MKDYFLWLAKIATLVLAVLICFSSVIAMIVGAASSKKMLTDLEGKSKHKVAVVEVHGVIEDSKDVLKELYAHARNKKVKAIVLDINSPGGAVGPSQAIYSAVKKLKSIKPIVAKMDGVAASGGLYAALGASKVLCQPGTMTGSIGVIMQIPNFTNIAKQVGFEMVTIKSGDLKDSGNAFRAFTEKDREYFQTTIDVAYEDFLEAVVSSRSLEKEKFKKYADGRVILGTQALEYGLVDGFGDIYDAAEAGLELANIKLEEGEFPKLVYKENKYEEIKELLSSWMFLPNIMTDRVKLMYLMG